jgi:hypothetical protein
VVATQIVPCEGVSTDKNKRSPRYMGAEGSDASICNWFVPAPPYYLPVMQFRSRRRSYHLIAAVAMIAALLLPEAGHGFAHHHAAEHHVLRVDEHHNGGLHDVAGDEAVSENHRHSDHPHVELLAGPPSRPPLVYPAIVVRVAALLLSHLDDLRPLIPLEATGLSPGNWSHGPPPPSRAPPQV